MYLPFKICCIQSSDEADLAVRAGALAVGLVGAMPNGIGPIDDERITEIAAHLRRRCGPFVWSVLLSSRTDGAALAEHVAQTGVNTVQIVDRPDRAAWLTLRRAHPALRIVQVVHVENEAAIEEAREAGEAVDFILLDSGKPSAETRTLGGTGNTHDWTISRRIVESVDRPVFLAGGLTPQNVRKAVRSVRPYGVDICSGLRPAETGHALDVDRLSRFTAALSRLRMKAA